MLAAASQMVGGSTSSSSAHCSNGAAIGRPRSGSCQVPTRAGYRTSVRGPIGNATDRNRTGSWGTLGAQTTGLYGSTADKSGKGLTW
jgi:hypothetical protein